MKKMERVVDSTKGSAEINPVSYKGDVLVQVWMDSRVLATISEWLDIDGNYTRFMSEVVKDSMQLLCDSIVANGEVRLIDDTAHARRMLERKYRVNLNPGNRGKRNRQHNIVLSERRKGVGIVSGTRVDNPMRKDECRFGNELDEAFRRLEEEKLKDRHENTRKAVEAAKENGMIVEDWEIEKLDHQYKEHEKRKGDKERALREGMSDEELDEYNKEREAEIIERENAPFDPSLVETVKEEQTV